MKKLLLIAVSLTSLSAIATTAANIPMAPNQGMGAQGPAQMAQNNLQDELARAKQAVKVSEDTIQMQEARIEDTEFQMEQEKLNMKRMKNNLDEQKAHVKRLENIVEGQP